MPLARPAALPWSILPSARAYGDKGAAGNRQGDEDQIADWADERDREILRRGDLLLSELALKPFLSHLAVGTVRDEDVDTAEARQMLRVLKGECSFFSTIWVKIELGLRHDFCEKMERFLEDLENGGDPLSLNEGVEWDDPHWQEGAARTTVGSLLRHEALSAMPALREVRRSGNADMHRGCLFVDR